MARRDDYGRILSTQHWRGPTPRRRWWRAWRPWALLAVLLGAWWALGRYGPEQPAFKGTPQPVALQFHRCGAGRGPNCVVDGDTFIMAKRHIRITGIDAPEIGAKARCPAEAQGAEVAAQELLRLLNQGPFVMQSSVDGLRDDYGRELMTVTRVNPAGAVQDIAQDLIASGKVRRYEFGSRESWC